MINSKPNLISLIILVAGVLIWEMLTYYELFNPLFFPRPSVIFLKFIELWSDGTLLIKTWESLSLIFRGLFYGGIIGLLLGVLLGLSITMRDIFDPILALIHPLPKISILPLLMIIFGFTETPALIALAVTGFFPIYINTLNGVKELDPVYFDVASNFRLSKGIIFRRLIFPGVLPAVLSGIRLSFITVLTLNIAMEIIYSRKGLGQLIWLSWQTLHTKDLYATIITIAIIGYVFNYILNKLSVWFMPWQREINLATR